MQNNPSIEKKSGIRPLPVPGPKAKAMIERDQAVISPSYPRGYPFVMDYGKGCEVWDVDGNRFLDFAAGIAVVSTGHSHPRVVKAIQEQAEKFIHISSDFYHEKWIELGETLNRIAPFNEPASCFMTNSGTESVEAAIKLARYHTGRTQFVGFLGGFHGRTMGAVTFTASKPHYHRGFFPLMSGVVHAPFPDAGHQILASPAGADYGETVVKYIEEEIFGKTLPPEDVAGILVEPIQGEGGYIIPAPGFFPALRKLCDRHGILLIADEVQSGMGRTGQWWAIENFDTEPDMVCVAKGIASGVPLGALIARRHLMTWPKGAHGNTYGGNPIACAAALATIDLIETELMENASRVGAYAIECLHEIAERHAIVGQPRGLGLMIGIDIISGKDPRADEKLREDVVNLAFERGLLLLGCGKNTIRFSPPLCVSHETITEGMQIFEEAIIQAELRL
jgi:4-aminobutyrate aminotransferase